MAATAAAEPRVRRWKRYRALLLRGERGGGGQLKLGPAAEATLGRRLASDPRAHGHRATGWTAPML